MLKKGVNPQLEDEGFVELCWYQLNVGIYSIGMEIIGHCTHRYIKL